MKKNQTTAVLVETAKTVGGVMAGRMVAVAGKKALKINEETDPKKKKIKEVAIGAGIAGVGIVGALKLPNEYKSIAAGFATAGALTAMTPFAKGEDQGFVPALHGTAGMAALEEGYSNYEDNDEEVIDLEENEAEFEVNALASLRGSDDEEYDEEDQEVVAEEVN